MNIILTDIANLSVFIVPVVPAGTEIKVEQVNDTEDTLSGNIRIMKNSALRKLSWASFFPVNKHYNFVPRMALSNGWLYVTFIELMRRFRLPIRVIGTTTKKVPVFNFLASIDDFSWNLDKVGDINYSITLTEFPEGFFEFINRDKEVYKYIKEYLESKDKISRLKNAGLIVLKKLRW